MNFLPNNDEESIIKVLNNAEQNRNELLKKAMMGRDYVIAKASNVYQNKKIVSFIQAICHDKYC